MNKWRKSMKNKKKLDKLDKINWINWVVDIHCINMHLYLTLPNYEPNIKANQKSYCNSSSIFILILSSVISTISYSNLAIPTIPYIYLSLWCQKPQVIKYSLSDKGWIEFSWFFEFIEYLHHNY